MPERKKSTYIACGLLAYTRSQKIYYYFIPTTYYYAFTSTETTIKQLENAGEMRLFRDMAVSDSITSYYELVHAAADQHATWTRYFDIYHQEEYHVFSWSQIDTLFLDPEPLLSMKKNLSLITYDKKTLEILFSKIYTMSMITRKYAHDLQMVYTKAVSTLNYISEVYKLK